MKNSRPTAGGLRRNAVVNGAEAYASQAAVAAQADAPSQSALTIGANSIEQIPVELLKPYPKNPRTHSKKQIRQLANSFRRFGFNGPIVINASNVIIAGHGRVEAAKLLGLQTVPCFRVRHLSAAEELAYVIADNKIASNSGWDRLVLASHFESLELELPALAHPIGTDITGFEEGEIDALFADLGKDQGDPLDEVELPRNGSGAVTKKGDLWRLGEHKLICGDARDPSIYADLMESGKADMVLCDPPWNVEVQGHVGGRGKTKHAEFAFASGEMTDDEYRRFLSTSIEQMANASRGGALIYVFIDWRHVEVLCEVGRSLGLVLSNICVWNKSTPGQGSFYRSAHELVVLFQKPGGAIQNNIALGRYGRSRTNVWTFASPNKFKSADDPLSGHPTPKPVAMIAEAIKDASKRRGIVLDGFLGSGTTILAAEKVGRVGYGIEFAPLYCDLSIARWQTFTGRDAILVDTAQTFEEVKAERTGTAQRAPNRSEPGAAAGPTEPSRKRGGQ